MAMANSRLPNSFRQVTTSRKVVGGVYLMYMKLYVYCDCGLEGIEYEVKWSYNEYVYDALGSW